VQKFLKNLNRPPPVKISIALSILILLVAGLFGLSNERQLTTVRESHAKLVASAAELGITIDPSHPSDVIRITKRERENKEAATKLVIQDFIAFAKEMEASEKAGERPSEAQEKRMMEMMDRLISLDTTQLKFFITSVQDATDLTDETRLGLISFSIMTLANDHPEAALTMFTQSPDLQKDPNFHQYIVSSAIKNWAGKDPTAALEWVKTNSPKFPNLITADVRKELISGVATENPRLAFKLISELAVKEAEQVISGIIHSASTPEEMTATLAALREHLATLKDEKARTELADNAMNDFTHGLVKSGFEAGVKWISESNLSPQELESFTGSLSFYRVEGADSGRWIQWVGEKLPPEKANDKVRSLMRTWTQDDYQAAGQWLTTAPDGPTKNSAIRSYAEAVSKYEPATAAQWALTLPPGKDRDRTLRTISRNWPKEDSAGQEAFKKEHGIE
jgi:hypothetical protein